MSASTPFKYVVWHIKHAVAVTHTCVYCNAPHQPLAQGKPKAHDGQTDDVATLATPGEVFVLRKLLPATSDYDFNIHVMDFQPGEFLNVKVRGGQTPSLCHTSHRAGGSLQSTWASVAAGPGHLPAGQQLVRCMLMR